MLRIADLSICCCDVFDACRFAHAKLDLCVCLHQFCILRKMYFEGVSTGMYFGQKGFGKLFGTQTLSEFWLECLLKCLLAALAFVASYSLRFFAVWKPQTRISSLDQGPTRSCSVWASEYYFCDYFGDAHVSSATPHSDALSYFPVEIDDQCAVDDESSSRGAECRGARLRAMVGQDLGKLAHLTHMRYCLWCFYDLWCLWLG